MPTRELEFRGINRHHLEMYFEELGGKRITDSFPIIFSTDNWNAYILSEEEMMFTKAFKVNVVHIRLSADNEERLEEVLKQYRYKTTESGARLSSPTRVVDRNKRPLYLFTEAFLYFIDLFLISYNFKFTKLFFWNNSVPPATNIIVVLKHNI